MTTMIEDLVVAADVCKDEEDASGSAYWDKNWEESIPASGKGRYVLQAHWRGLSEDEAKLSMEDLLKTDHSLHFDLRMEVNKRWLWGWTIFAGKTSENRANLRVSSLSQQKPLQVQPKLLQPHVWLRVGAPRPKVVAPGGAGSTSQTYAKFFIIGSGSYQIGVAQRSLFEIFVRGDGALKSGRYMIQRAEFTGRRAWVLSRPEDQKPFAESNKLETVARRLKSRGHRTLFWSVPGERLRKIDLKQDISKASLPDVEVMKSDQEKHLVWIVVMKPDFVDYEGQWASIETIERACHRWMLRGGKVFVEHAVPREDVKVVENYTLLGDLKMDGRTIPRGSWVAVFYIPDDKLWAEVKSGHLKGGSVRGFAQLRKGEPA